MTTITRPDWKKLKREIHAVTALQRKVGDDHSLSDLALYATYLYCIASQFRGHMHMKHWNILHPAPFLAGLSNDPRRFTLKLESLEHQQQFITVTREYILRKQNLMNTYNIRSAFKDLPLDFTREIEVEDVGTTVAQ